MHQKIQSWRIGCAGGRGGFWNHRGSTKGWEQRVGGIGRSLDWRFNSTRVPIVIIKHPNIECWRPEDSLGRDGWDKPQPAECTCHMCEPFLSRANREIAMIKPGYPEPDPPPRDTRNPPRWAETPRWLPRCPTLTRGCIARRRWPSTVGP